MYEYTAELPASVDDEARVTLTAVRDDPDYTSYSMSLVGHDYSVTEFTSDTVSAYELASDFRDAKDYDRTAEITLKPGVGDDVTYTITVTVQETPN